MSVPELLLYVTGALAGLAMLWNVVRIARTIDFDDPRLTNPKIPYDAYPKRKVVHCLYFTVFGLALLLICTAKIVLAL
jgi:hypothetical protein